MIRSAYVRAHTGLVNGEHPTKEPCELTADDDSGRSVDDSGLLSENDHVDTTFYVPSVV